MIRIGTQPDRAQDRAGLFTVGSSVLKARSRLLGCLKPYQGFKSLSLSWSADSCSRQPPLPYLGRHRQLPRRAIALVSWQRIESRHLNASPGESVALPEVQSGSKSAQASAAGAHRGRQVRVRMPGMWLDLRHDGTKGRPAEPYSYLRSPLHNFAGCPVLSP